MQVYADVCHVVLLLHSNKMPHWRWSNENMDLVDCFRLDNNNKICQVLVVITMMENHFQYDEISDRLLY